MGQTSRCFIVCSIIPTFTSCLSILGAYQFLRKALPHPVPVRRRFRLDQVGHASLEPGGSDSLGLKESLRTWCCREMTGPMVSLRVWTLPSGVQQSGGSCVFIGVPDGGGVRGWAVAPNSGSLSTLIRAESRDYSGKTQYMFD